MICLAPPATPGEDWTADRGDAAHAEAHIPGARYADRAASMWTADERLPLEVG